MHDQNIDEEVVLNKFKGAILRAGEIERDVEGMSSQGMSYAYIFFTLKVHRGGKLRIYMFWLHCYKIIFLPINYSP